ncbi:MAG: hypothetical protein BRD40_00065, partial [Bacteroidetes bacterium QS_1_65_9]
FRRSVVLLCEHSNGMGSFGLSLGRPLEQDLALSDVIDLGDAAARLQGEDFPLALGGPVQPETLHYVHRHGREAVPDATEIAEGIWWGGDFEDVKTLIADGEASTGSLRFFVGYAGWGAGQLRAEIDQDGWILTPADAELVFPESLEAFWRAVMRRMGGEYALLSNFPDDPRMN